MDFRKFIKATLSNTIEWFFVLINLLTFVKKTMLILLQQPEANNTSVRFRLEAGRRDTL